MADRDDWNCLLGEFFSGRSDRLLDRLAGGLAGWGFRSFFEQRFLEHAVESLKEYHRCWPRRNRELADGFGLGDGAIGKAELDDVLAPAFDAPRRSIMSDNGTAQADDRPRTQLSDPSTAPQSSHDADP